MSAPMTEKATTSHDLGPLAQHQHQRHLPLVLRHAARVGSLEPFGHAFDRRLRAQEHPQTLGELGRRLVERLHHLDPRTHIVALQFRRQHQQHGRARLEQVAELRQAFGEEDGLVMPSRIG